jgi:hypothetical protein
MPNLRVIYNNVSDRAATLVANTSANATTLPVTNLQNDYKGKVHRTTGTTAVYTFTWAANQTIGGVILPATNLSSTATILVQAFSDTAATTQLNTGAVAISACPTTSLEEWTKSGTAAASINVNLFPYGGLSKTSWWFSQQYTTVRALRVTLTDSSNPAGYIDCARLVCGAYWSPTYNVDRSGLNLTVTDSSTVSRTDNGDLLAEQGFVFDELSFSLGVMADSDRNTLVDIMRKYGTTQNIAVSVFPDGTNTRQEQIYTVYGKRDNSEISYLFPGLSSHSMKIIGW